MQDLIGMHRSYIFGIKSYDSNSLAFSCDEFDLIRLTICIAMNDSPDVTVI